MRVTWDDDEMRKRDEQLRERARKHLDRLKHRLPRLTKLQAETIVDMMLNAYRSGQFDGWMDGEIFNREAMEKRATRGVEARRAKSARMAIRAEFEAARDTGKSITAKQLAKKHGASLPTVYRALHGLLKQPKG